MKVCGREPTHVFLLLASRAQQEKITSRYMSTKQDFEPQNHKILEYLKIRGIKKFIDRFHSQIVVEYETREKKRGPSKIKRSPVPGLFHAKSYYHQHI